MCRSGRLSGGQGDCQEVRETVGRSGRLSEAQGNCREFGETV